MKVENYKIPGLLLITLDIYKDERGYFVERFHEKRLREALVEKKTQLPQFVQDNHSRSAPRVLRGLHAQTGPNQSKLIGAIRGKIWDVAIDLRKGSPTYGKWAGVELDDQAGQLLFIPGGFAHGFCVLGNEPADVLYKVDQHYDPNKEIGFAWNDPFFNIQWPISQPLLSPRDLNHLPVEKREGWAGVLPDYEVR